MAEAADMERIVAEAPPKKHRVPGSEASATEDPPSYTLRLIMENG